MKPFCRASIVFLGTVILFGCNDKSNPASTSNTSTSVAKPLLDANAILKHKIECRTLGAQVEKDQFPDGLNTVDNLNNGFMYFESEYGYSEALNTCIMLTGFQHTDFKTNTVNSYQVTLTDLLANKTLATYFLVGDRLMPTSARRDDFVAKVRDLLGDPLPQWLVQGPLRAPENPSPAPNN